MSLSTTKAIALSGLNGEVITVEVDIADGLPGFTLLGLPDAQSKICWKIFSPMAWMEDVPSTISPQLMSISSSCFFHRAVLVDSFREGEGAHPYAEPRPVVKQMMLAPPATWPVALTGS